jgi:signal transduction histidine kinase/ligand-binding sensor domain-containing protein/DNA-binding response OmpR family regulator
MWKIERAVSILFIFVAPLLSAQEYIHYTTIDGLSGTDVTAICENENYLWIATNDGLNRFDGREFKVYRNNSASNNCLTENNIETLMFDSRGLLWIGFKTGGVDIFNPRENRFTHISEIIDDYPQRVISIYEDSQNNIWLGSWEDGLYQLEPVDKDELLYKVSKHYPQNIISGIIEKPTGKLWIGTYFGYFLYDIEKRKDINIKRNYHSITQFLDTGQQNGLWFSTWTNGLHKLEWDENTFSVIEREINSEVKNVYRIFSTADNQFYIGTWGDGVKKINLENASSIISLKTDTPVIMSFFQDRYNKVWMGTYGNGLYRLDNDARSIIGLSPVNRNGFSAVYALQYLGDNYMLIGTQGDGLFLYDIDKQVLQPKEIKGEGNFFHNYILSLYSDDELLIVGNDETGMMYTSQQGNNYMDFSLKKFRVDNNFGKVTSIFRSSKSLFWIGTKQFGLVSVKYDFSNGLFTDYTHYDSFGMDEITGFAEASDGQIWVSSHSGIYLFDPATNKNQRYGESISEIVYSLVDNKKNNCLWMGTSCGLRKLNYSEGDEIENPFSPEMLPDGAIRNVILDEYDNLWFSISSRIFCYVNANHELKEINPGALNKQVFFSSAHCDINKKQYIVFGGTENLLLIDPQTVLSQPNHTRILLTELQIDHQIVTVGQKVHGKVILHEDTEYINSLTLSYLCRWISFSFTEVGWDNYQNSYQYQIKGFSEKWQHLDISKPITFSLLPSGDYTFLIRANGESLAERSDPFWSLHISISPPWWKTNLFYLILSAVILLILSGLSLYTKNYYKKRQLQRFEEIEKKKKEELLKEKESFFAGLSHDLLTPFSLIIAPVKDLMRDRNMNDDQQEKLEIISKNATFLSDIFNTILDFKRAELIDTEIKEKNVELISFIRIIVNAFDYLAKSNGIELSYKPDITSLFVSIDTIKLERVLYNLISNALKFTKEGGKVEVILTYNEQTDVFYIKINDTGIGINEQNHNRVFEKFYQEGKVVKSQGFGLGLYTARKFIRLMGGDINIDSIPEKGTTITIDLPAKITETIDSVSEDKEDVNTNLFTILLVEDNDQLRDYLKNKLLVHFEVGLASNGVEALAFIKNNLPEIVISDVMMPEMDGFTLCSTIKNTPMYSDIFVILLSAKASTEDEIQGYKAGADFYIKKPFDADTLINQMTNVYATRQRHRKQIIADLLSPQNENAQLQPKDNFLQRTIRIIEEHLMDENFKLDEFASEMNLSKTVLHRKFKLIIGETPNIFVRNVRLKKAANMLKETELSVSEIAYLSGFNQVHYFIKCFKDLYKTTPKNFRMQNKYGHESK